MRHGRLWWAIIGKTLIDGAYASVYWARVGRCEMGEAVPSTSAPIRRRFSSLMSNKSSRPPLGDPIRHAVFPRGPPRLAGGPGAPVCPRYAAEDGVARRARTRNDPHGGW